MLYKIQDVGIISVSNGDMDHNYMEIWTTITWRYGPPLHGDMDHHYMEIWTTITWRYGPPLHGDMDHHYMEIWTTITWRYGPPLHGDMDHHGEIMYYRTVLPTTTGRRQAIRRHPIQDLEQYLLLHYSSECVWVFK